MGLISAVFPIDWFIVNTVRKYNRKEGMIVTPDSSCSRSGAYFIILF